MIRKMLVIAVVVLMGMLIVPSGQSIQTFTVQNRGQGQGQFTTIASTSPDTNYKNTLQIQSNDTGSCRGLFYMPFIFDPSSIQKVQIGLRTSNIHNSGYNISIYSINATEWDKEIVTWNNRSKNAGVNVSWNNPGGDYNYTPIDTVEVDTNLKWYYWDITPFYLDSVNNESTDNYHGFILISDNTDSTYRGATFISASSSNRENYPKMIYTYSKSTTLLKNQWNLKGYANLTAKKASTIFSAITNCSALSYKNATSGYYYTYWPDLGIVEDEYIEFGDGLFILTSSNSTWDHT